MPGFQKIVKNVMFDRRDSEDSFATSMVSDS